MRQEEAGNMNDGLDLAKLFQTIGALGAKIDSLIAQQSANEQRAADAELRASENRSRQYEKLEDLARRMHTQEIAQTRLESAVTSGNGEIKVWMREVDDRLDKVEQVSEAHAKTFNEVKPVVDLVKKWEQRGIGIALILTLIGVMFGALLVNFKANLVKMFVNG